MKQVFIIGAGYVGGKLARRYLDSGAQVQALVRSDESWQRMEKSGVTPVSGDLDDVWSLRRLRLNDSLVFYMAPPPTNDVNDLRMRTFVNALPPRHAPQKIVLISTTGVYGDCGGRWIDETEPANPQSDRARRRLDSENVLRAWGRAQGIPIIVLRTAGIYGPDRLPLERLHRHEPVLQQSESPFSNRIHVEDLVTVCQAAADHGRDQQIYNVSDGHPSTMTEYFFAVADAVGLPRPPELTMRDAEIQLSPGMMSYLTESRRLRNDKILNELKVTLRFPDLESGLRGVKQAP